MSDADSPTVAAGGEIEPPSGRPKRKAKPAEKYSELPSGDLNPRQGKTVRVQRVKKKSKDSVPAIVEAKDIPMQTQDDIGITDAIECMPELEVTPGRKRLLDELASCRKKFWAAVHAACTAYQCLNFFDFRGSDAVQYPYLAWWPMDLYLIFKTIQEAGGLAAVDEHTGASLHLIPIAGHGHFISLRHKSLLSQRATEGPRETLAEDNEMEEWNGAWENVFLVATSFMGSQEKVDEVPWRRSKMRRLYWETVGKIMEKTPMSVFTNALTELRDGKDVLQQREFVRCVCGHSHESPLRGKLKVCGGCSTTREGKAMLRCDTCGVWQHLRCVEDFGLLNGCLVDAEDEGCGMTDQDEDAVVELTDMGQPLPKHYECELCQGLALDTAKAFFTARMRLGQRIMMERTPALYKFEMPQDWACSYVYRRSEQNNGDWYVHRGFAQIINGPNMACIRSKPALEKFLAPSPPGKLVDDPTVDYTRYIAGYSAKREKGAKPNSTQRKPKKKGSRTSSPTENEEFASI
jgi:hypothetical protein